jgi:hypothetical protein
MTTTECTHNWTIATAQAPQSPGTCKLCGAAKIFQNFIADTKYFSTRDGKSTLSERSISSVSGIDRTIYPEPEE